jgi:hypothetical protein
MAISNKRRRTKWIVLAAIVSTVVIEAAFSFVLPWWHPDREFRLRKEIIESRVAQQPDDPLFVIVGSSRIAAGFDPGLFEDLRTPQGKPVLGFNFAHTESGPVSNLLQVKRLLHVGIKPRWLIVELLPSCCCDEWCSFVHNITWEDVPTVSRYHPYRRFAGSFARNHFLVPWFRHRADLQEYYLHESFDRQNNPYDLNKHGCAFFACDIVPEDKRKEWTETAHRLMGPALTDQFKVTPESAGAYRELIALCRKEGIELMLLLTPEGNTYRTWYNPAVEIRLQAFLKELTDEFQVPICDARPWFDDSFFADSHHLTQTGRREFTLKVERDILRPWIHGKPSEVAHVNKAEIK